MQDYSSSGPVHKTPHRPIGFVYIIPLGLVIGFLLFAANHVWKTVTTDFSGVPARPSPKQQALLQVSQSPTETPTPEPAESTAREDISVHVLNGSGVAGAAGKVADLLREKGYTKVTTGNADEYTYTDITIRAGGENKALSEQVKTDLEEDLTIAGVETADIASASDVEVIVGKSDVEDDSEAEE